MVWDGIAKKNKSINWRNPLYMLPAAAASSAFLGSGGGKGVDDERVWHS